MKRRFTEEQIIGFLKQAEAGVPVKDLCRKHGFSGAAFYGWRSKCWGLQAIRSMRSLDGQVFSGTESPASWGAHSSPRLRFNPFR